MAPAAVAQVAQTATNPPKDLVRCLIELTAEVRNLRLELLEQRLERQDQTITLLQNQVDNIRADQRRLEEQERSTARELAELNHRLSQPDINQEERTQLEHLRTMAMTTGAEHLAAKRASASQEEIKVRELLAREQRRRQTLLDTAQQLRGSSGQQQ
jgi:predicted nuclease with TOPRIM domain